MLPRLVSVPQRVLVDVRYRLRCFAHTVNMANRKNVPVMRQMASRILAFVTLLAASGLARAQPSYDGGSIAPVAVGVQGGVGIVWFGGEDASSSVYTTSNSTGFAAGAFATLALAHWLSAQPEVLFMVKGPKSELIAVMQPGEYRLSYLEVPLLARVAPYQIHRLQPYLLAGPAIAFLLTCQFASMGETEDCKRNGREIDVSLIGAAGVSVALPWPGAVTVEIRYDHGLRKVDDSDLKQDTKNRAVLFSIGYSHRLGGADRH
jgi:Outer membrane protein beta-barrel domain